MERQISEKFIPLLGEARYKCLHGGRGSGKSHFWADRVVIETLRRPCRVVCVREVQSSIKESVKQLIVDKITELNVGSEFQVLDQEIRGVNGSLIIFRGMQSYNSENIKSLEGFDICWVEEAQVLSATSLRMLRPTLRREGSEFWFSYNPRYPTDAVDSFFRGANKIDRDAIVIEANWSDNLWFPQTLRSEMELDYRRDPEMAHHVWGGGYEILTEGSYYGKYLAIADREYRITTVSHDSNADVYAAWDLGIGDATAIWIFQVIGTEWHFLKCYENVGVGLDHYVDWIKTLPYNVNNHLLPHDAKAKEMSSGKSRDSYLEGRGLICQVLPRHGREDGIAAVRAMLSRAWFDGDGCAPGISALRAYRSEFNEHLGVFKDRPIHDASSHFADAFRYAVMGTDEFYVNIGRPGARNGSSGRVSDWKKPINRESAGTYA